jgi:hypothetical protein
VSESIKIPQSIHFCPEDHDPGETIVLLTGEPGAISVVATVYNFYDFPCLEDDQAEECHKAATAIAEKITRSYSSHNELLAALEANHKWHQTYDDSGTYEGSELWTKNTEALAKAKGETA